MSVPSEYNLLVEGYAQSDTGRARFTGYPIAPGRVLTARHGVLPEVPPAQKRIEVRWHHQTGEHRSWRAATVEWDDEALDAAVLACAFPPGIDGFVPPWDERPRADMTWESQGIAAAGDKDEETSGAFPFKGGVYPAADSETRFHTGIDDECDEAQLYKGASGMPVFVAHRIIGIALTAGGPAAGRRFQASPTWRMLADNNFRRAIGYEQREERRRQAQDEVARLLAPPHCAPMRQQLAARLRAKSFEAEALTAALFDSDLEAALRAVHQALNAVGPGEKERNRTLACDLAGQILPIGFDPGAIDGTLQRCDFPDALCLELPAGIETVAEVIMAGIRARPAYFKALANRKRYPVGRDALSPPPETGFDEDGKAFERNIHADLCNRLVAGDEATFDAFLIDELIDARDRDTYRRSGVSEEALKDYVADELIASDEDHGRRYYFVLDPAIGAAQANVLPALANLKCRYRLLDFVVLGYAGDDGIVGRERRRFRLLRDILPSRDENPR